MIVMKNDFKKEKYLMKNSYDFGKENNSNSENQSLLLNSIHPEEIYKSQKYYVSLQESKIKQQKLNQSSLKQSRNKNVFVDENMKTGWEKESNCKQCKEKIDFLIESISLINLKIGQIESTINVSFVNQAQLQLKNKENEHNYQEVKYISWETKEKCIQLQTEQTKHENRSNLQLKEVFTKIEEFEKSIKRYEGKVLNKGPCLESKRLQIKMNANESEMDEKLSKLIEVVQEIGTIQKQTIKDAIKEHTSADLHCCQSKAKYLDHRSRGYSVQQKKNTRESTHISFSRNVDSNK